MLSIKGQTIFDENGKKLKEIGCPHRVTTSELQRVTPTKLLCEKCSKDIIDTDYFTEAQIIEILNKDKETCLKINPINPIFNFKE